MLAGLGAILYRTGQEIGWIPKDVVVFPFLALLAWVLFLYWFLAGPRAVRLYNKAYKKWAKEKRPMAYGLAILVGSVIGGGTGAAWWKLFESHRDQMASKLKEKPPEAVHPPAQPEPADKQIDPEVSRIRADAKSLIYRLYTGYKSFRADVAWWDSRTKKGRGSGAPQVMVNQRWDQFKKKYDGEYYQRVIEVRNRLLGHIARLPERNSRIDDAYRSPLDFPGDISEQLADLRLLLNQMEKENNLPLSCADVDPHWRPADRPSLGRHLTDDQKIGLSNLADTIPKNISISVRVLQESPDSVNYGKEIQSALNAHGFKAGWIIWAANINPPPVGVIVATLSGSPTEPAFNTAVSLQLGMNNIGIPTTSANFPLVGAKTGVEIVVGVKPSYD